MGELQRHMVDPVKQSRPPAHELVLHDDWPAGRAALPPLEGPLGTASLWKILKNAARGSVM